MQLCKAKTAKGEPCRNHAHPDYDGYCRKHVKKLPTKKFKVTVVETITRELWVKARTEAEALEGADVAVRGVGKGEFPDDVKIVADNVISIRRPKPFLVTDQGLCGP